MPGRWLVLTYCLLLLACSPGQHDQAILDTAAVEDFAPPLETAFEPVPVQLHENVRTETYLLTGRRAAEIRADLNRKRPHSPADGRRYDAITTWSLRWTFRYNRAGGACSLAAATIELDIVVTLPEMEDEPALPPRTLASWQAYRQALADHEQGHVDRHTAAAQDLQSALQSMPAATNCRDLAAALREMGEAEIAAMRAADFEYDQVTDHGRLQGAVFP